jgi:prephenate dehydrogenase
MWLWTGCGKRQKTCRLIRDTTAPKIGGVHCRKITLVGVGLLGSSLGKAIRKRRLADLVIGFVRRTASVKECEMMGAADRATRDLADAVSGAELIVLCTPIAQMAGLVRQMLPAVRAGTIITDVGSVKTCVARDLEPLAARAGAHFVGSHPMAGAEKTGVAAGRSDLFVNAVCAVTPTRNSNRAAVRKVGQLWKAAGAQVLFLSPETHDDLVSRSSHLPHVVASQLASLVLNPEYPKRQSMLCANGFRDTTRVASSSPEMWRDIALSNRTNLMRALTDFLQQLTNFKRALKNGDSKAISRFFGQAKRRRDRWIRRDSGEYRL